MKQDFLSKYTIVHTYPEQQQTILRERQTNQLVLMKVTEVAQNTQLKTLVEGLELQKELQHHHILRLLDYQIKHHLDAAGCVWEVISFYEYAEQSLEKELDSRVEAQNYFDEDEIWSLLYSVVLGCAYLQEHNIGHGCITTSDIYLADNGHIRIVDPTLSSLSPYYLSEGYYYSPEMIGKFRGNAHMGEVNIFKSDVFTLAMCLLHCCLLDSCDDCYDYQQCCLLPHILKQKFNRLVGIYSRQLLELLYQMLTFQEKNRMDMISLSAVIQSILEPHHPSHHHTQSILLPDTPSQHCELVAELVCDMQMPENNEIVVIEEVVDESHQEVEQVVEEILTQKKGVGEKDEQEISSQFTIKKEYGEGACEEDRHTKYDSKEAYTVNKQNSVSQAPQPKMIKLSTSRNMMKNSNSREWHKYRQHESEGTQVFTDPKLLEMMKHDIQRIMCKRVS